MQKLVCLPFSRYLVLSYPQFSAKNIVLAGVRSVTIYDPEPVTLQDLSSQVIKPIGRSLFSSLHDFFSFFSAKMM